MTDPVMNPPAPSGRLEDSSLTTTGGERFALPTGTRMYVDSGGAKHFLAPDGSHHYVPPGEVGNFYLEGEQPMDALRRYLVQEIPYVDAPRVDDVVTKLFGALDEARKIGVSLKLVPLNAEDDKVLGGVLDRAYKPTDSQEFPKWKYHAEQGGKVVSNKDEESKLEGGEWHDDPQKADEAKKSGDKQSFEPPTEQREEDARRIREQADRDDVYGVNQVGGVIKPDVAPGDRRAPVS